MENVIIWIFWAIVILVSVVNAANKAKKKKDEIEKAARRREQQSYGSDPAEAYAPESGRQYLPKSLGQILEELANPQPQQRPVSIPEPEFVEEEPSYAANPGEIVYKEGRARTPREAVYAEGRSVQRETYAEGGRVTKEPVGPDNAGKGRKEATGTRENAARPKDVHDGENSLMREVLGGEFDLRRAIIEAEIITPKYF